jgi:predicted transcriptional regulator
MGILSATSIHELIKSDKVKIQASKFSPTTDDVYRLFCREPVLSNRALVEKLNASKPTIERALKNLQNLGIIKEISGKSRGRRYVYHAYIEILTLDTTNRIG